MIAKNSPLIGIAVITLIYLLAAFFNFKIPKTPIDHPIPKRDINFLLHDFWHAFCTLWRDTQGQVSLAVTTLFWGAGSTLQFVVLSWAESRLQFNKESSAILIGILAIGIAVGSVLASLYVKLEQADKVLPAGIYMGVLVIGMIFVGNPIIAAVLLFLIGVLAGYFLVPLNSLLQHRGHTLLGPGHSIAVQNFNENIGIAIMLGAYALMVHYQININIIIITFGVFIIVSMGTITHLYRKHISQKAV